MRAHRPGALLPADHPGDGDRGRARHRHDATPSSPCWWCGGRNSPGSRAASCSAQRSQEYVEAAQVIGFGPARILLRQIMPNAVGPLIVLVTLDVGNAILVFAGLSFLGLGVVPPTPEWGSMVAEGRELVEQWWVATFPGLAILTVVMGFNFLGDGIRDWLDPHAAPALSRCPTSRGRRRAGAGGARPAHLVPHRRRHRPRGRRRQLHVQPGETLGIVGESGSGKSVTAQVAHAAARRAGAHRRRRDPLPGPRRARASGRRGTARRARRRDRHGVPGPDDVAQSGAAHRATAHRDDDGARPLQPSRGAARARSTCCGRMGIAAPERAVNSLPAPVLRRHAPARDAGHGLLQRARRCSSPTSRRRRST